LKSDPNELNNIYDENLNDVINLKQHLINHFKENEIVINVNKSIDQVFLIRI